MGTEYSRLAAHSIAGAQYRGGMQDPGCRIKMQGAGCIAWFARIPLGRS